MKLELTDEQSAVRATAKKAARDLLAPDAATNDREARFPRENLKQLARLGLMGVNVPFQYGGSEAGVVAYALAVQELAAGCAGTTVAMMVTNMVAEAIVQWGDESQRSRFLPRLLSGDDWVTASFCLSEPGSGSDASSLCTTARRDGDDYILDGTKAWITSGGHSGLYLIMARTGGIAGARGISTFLVQGDNPGLIATKPEDKMGLRASTTTQIVLDGCRVPMRDRLGDEGTGFRVAMTALDGGRIGVSAQALGIATAALTAATRYATERRQFDRRIADFGAIQDMIADSATELDAGTLLCLRAASLKDRGVAHSKEAAMSKVFCTEAANHICHRAVQIHGGYGYTRDYPVERHLRDVRITRIYEGTSEVQRIVVAREALNGVN